MANGMLRVPTGGYRSTPPMLLPQAPNLPQMMSNVAAARKAMLEAQAYPSPEEIRTGREAELAQTRARTGLMQAQTRNIPQELQVRQQRVELERNQLEWARDKGLSVQKMKAGQEIMGIAHALAKIGNPEAAKNAWNAASEYFGNDPKGEPILQKIEEWEDAEDGGYEIKFANKTAVIYDPNETDPAKMIKAKEPVGKQEDTDQTLKEKAYAEWKKKNPTGTILDFEEEWVKRSTKPAAGDTKEEKRAKALKRISEVELKRANLYKVDKMDALLAKVMNRPDLVGAKITPEIRARVEQALDNEIRNLLGEMGVDQVYVPGTGVISTQGP